MGLNLEAEDSRHCVLTHIIFDTDGLRYPTSWMERAGPTTENSKMYVYVCKETITFGKLHPGCFRGFSL
jgi:hypothetical protein